MSKFYRIQKIIKSNTLLFPFYDLNRDNRRLIYKNISPLLQMQKQIQFLRKVYQMKAEDLTIIRGKYKNKKIRRYEGNRILVLYASYELNVYRSKLINKKRNMIIQVLNAIGKNNLIYYIHLNRINFWVPDKQLKLHLQYLLQNKIPKEKQTIVDNPYHIVKQFTKYNLSWKHYIRPQGYRNTKNHSITMQQYESLYCHIIFNNIYFLQNRSEKQNIYMDMLTLSKFLKRFNIFDFFCNLKYHDKKLSTKICQRFIKSIKWRSHQSQKYLLYLIKNRQIAKIYETIFTLLQIYEKYFKQ